MTETVQKAHSHRALMAAMIAIDETDASDGVILRAFEWAHACVATRCTLDVQWQSRAAAANMLVELLLETLAQQVESERVDTRVGERQNASSHTGDKVQHGRVHFRVVIGAVQVDDVAGEPADSKEAHEHQHHLSQPLPWLHLRYIGKDNAPLLTT